MNALRCYRGSTADYQRQSHVRGDGGGDGAAAGDALFVAAAEADAAMRATCTAAKANEQMVVYTIYFGDANTGNNGPSNAETLLSDCASGPGQFYNVTALDIEAAFASIAISVQKLKLTQ